VSVREEVVKAIERREPAFVPIWIPADAERSDVVAFGYGLASDFQPSEPGATEWGYVWETLDGTIGQPRDPAIKSWEDLADYRPPDANASGRLAGFEKGCLGHADKYIMGAMGITGFNQMTFIRGFQNVLEDLYVQRDNLSRLGDIVFGFEEDMIRNFAREGANAVTFFDDWGTQDDLMIDPALWREEFKPRYARQFALIHELGMHVFFHSCGNVYKIIADLIEIGADMVNLNQINLLGIDRLAAEFAGKICFACPVDNQRTYTPGTIEDIRREAKHLVDAFGRPNGGFMALVERYECFDIPEDKYEAAISAFREFGTY